MSLQGRRGLDNADHDSLKEPGDYYLVKDEQGIKVLWGILPNGFFCRLPARQLGEGNPPKENLAWSITENPDGTVTVDPSIEAWDRPEKAAAGPDHYWHGHLVNGVWE